jgi:hypothetical protein
MAIITGSTWKIGAVTEKPRSCQAFSSCNRSSKLEPGGDVFSMPFYTYIVNYKGNNHALQEEADAYWLGDHVRSSPRQPLNGQFPGSAGDDVSSRA